MKDPSGRLTASELADFVARGKKLPPARLFETPEAEKYAEISEKTMDRFTPLLLGSGKHCTMRFAFWGPYASIAEPTILVTVPNDELAQKVMDLTQPNELQVRCEVVELTPWY